MEGKILGKSCAIDSLIVMILNFYTVITNESFLLRYPNVFLRHSQKKRLRETWKLIVRICHKFIKLNVGSLVSVTWESIRSIVYNFLSYVSHTQHISIWPNYKISINCYLNVESFIPEEWDKMNYTQYFLTHQFSSQHFLCSTIYFSLQSSGSNQSKKHENLS